MIIYVSKVVRALHKMHTAIWTCFRIYNFWHLTSDRIIDKKHALLTNCLASGKNLNMHAGKGEGMNNKM